MYRAILCDDDEIILEGMKYFIEQEFSTIELVGVASDGRTCRDYIQQFKPDILITDIRLPDCLGFDLIECAQAVNENTAIVIISGYDDFQYAKKALKAGALGYISKPIDLEEFTEIINLAQDRCQQNIKNEQWNRRSFLTDILDSKVTNPELIAVKSKELNLAEDVYYTTAIIELDTENPAFQQMHFQKQQDIFKHFAQVTEATLPDRFFVLRRSIQQVVLLIESDTKEDIDILITHYHKSLQDDAIGILSYYVTTAYGRTVGSLTSLPKSYEDAVTALNFKFFMGLTKCISYQDIASLSDAGLPSIDHMDFSKLGEISINDKENIEQNIQQISAHLRPLGKVSRSYARVLLEQIILSISKEMSQYEIALSDIFTSPVDEMKSILDAGDLNLMLDNFRIFYNRAAEYAENQQHSKYAKTIHNAVKYIEDNLSHSDLNVNDVAKHVYLSSGYFSLIFKNQTGETFSDYLIRLRIEKAKELIQKTNLKFFEISYMIGYENVSHFNVIFKKYTGLTPSQYRRNK